MNDFMQALVMLVGAIGGFVGALYALNMTGWAVPLWAVFAIGGAGCAAGSIITYWMTGGQR